MQIIETKEEGKKGMSYNTHLENKTWKSRIQYVKVDKFNVQFLANWGKKKNVMYNELSF